MDKGQTRHPLGYPAINVAADGENSIALAPGANSYLIPEVIMNGRDAFAGQDPCRK